MTGAVCPDTPNAKGSEFQPPLEEVVQAGGFDQPQGRDQTGHRYQVLVIETGRMLCEAFNYEVSLARAGNRFTVTPILQPSKGFLVLRHARPTTLTGGFSMSLSSSSCCRFPWWWCEFEGSVVA